MPKNDIGHNPNIKNLSKLRDEIREKIAAATKEPEDPSETTPPEPQGEPVAENKGEGEKGELDKGRGGAETANTTEENKDLGLETPVEDGNKKDEAEENAAKLAKKASKIANMIAAIRRDAGQKVAAEGEYGDDKKEESKEGEPKKEEAKEGEPKKEEPKEGEGGTEDKEATVKELLESLDVHSIYKLAAVVLGTEKLAADVTRELNRFMDKQAARQVIDDAMFFAQQYNEDMQKQASFVESLEDMVKNASETELAEIEKIKKVHSYGLSKLASEEEKQAYMGGAGDAAAVMDNNNEVPLPAETAEPSDEELIEVIEEMVAAGELPPEEADALITELVEGEAAGGEEELDEETLAALLAAEEQMGGAAPAGPAAPMV